MSFLRTGQIANNQIKRFVLIGGDSGVGKSYLANQLAKEFGFHLVHLDKVYTKFIESQFPNLYFPFLSKFILQHYQTIFSVSDQAGILPKAIVAWENHVASLAKDLLADYQYLAIEGFHLTQGNLQLKLIEDLRSAADITTIQVLPWRYFVNGELKSFDELFNEMSA